MLPVQHLTEDRVTKLDKLWKVQKLDHKLVEVKRRLTVERAVMDYLRAELADKVKQLQASQAREADLTAKVEALRKQLDLLKGQSAKMEVCALNAEEQTEKA